MCRVSMSLHARISQYIATSIVLICLVSSGKAATHYTQDRHCHIDINE